MRCASARRAASAVAVLAVLSTIAAGCSAPRPPAAPPPPATCSSSTDEIRFHGDSLGIHLPTFVSVPGADVVNRSEPRSGFTYEIPVDPARGLPAVASIGRTVRTWIENCGVPRLVVIEGGINDLAGRSLPATEIEASVTALSDWLEERQVPTVWLPVHPLPTAGNYMWAQAARQEYNAWLSAGHVWGTVVDCNHAIEDPARPDTMSPQYWWVIDIWGTVDGVHPDMDGYRAWGECVGTHLPPLAPG